ncbi:hypothetical protein OK015_08240 [Mycobacterium sp. Aquia_216]|nr:hypothetical protein [Mycobacterium sp. Aquia_216]WAJ46440.1 hypothetical protein OK015_08240 [Mycobacterium sp. Aquia_216]
MSSGVVAGRQALVGALNAALDAVVGMESETAPPPVTGGHAHTDLGDADG